MNFHGRYEPFKMSYCVYMVFVFVCRYECKISREILDAEYQTKSHRRAQISLESKTGQFCKGKFEFLMGNRTCPLLISWSIILYLLNQR